MSEGTLADIALKLAIVSLDRDIAELSRASHIAEDRIAYYLADRVALEDHERAALAAVLWGNDAVLVSGRIRPAQALSDLIEVRKALPAAQKPAQRRSGSRPRSGASMERRRRWAASGCLPPALAARFTLAEQAVLAVVASEHRKRGDCRLTNKEIGDIAGVGITTAKTAIRAAEGLNLLSRQERRLHAFRNAANVLRIVSHEWRAWLKLQSPSKGGGEFAPCIPTQQKEARPPVADRASLRLDSGHHSGECASPCWLSKP